MHERKTTDCEKCYRRHRGARYSFSIRRETEREWGTPQGFVYLFGKCTMPVDLTAEFEAAIQALRELCDETVDLAERKHRLGVRKEMNRLYRLHEELKALAAEVADTGESETLTEIRNHLEPLGLAPENTPVPELARLAALKITEK